MTDYDLQQELHRQKMVQVVAKAMLYEAAWTRYANPSFYTQTATEAELIVAKAEAHQALLDAVRLLRVPDPPLPSVAFCSLCEDVPGKACRACGRTEADE